MIKNYRALQDRLLQTGSGSGGRSNEIIINSNFLDVVKRLRISERMASKP